MDAEKFKGAQEKYQAGDYRSAARGFLDAAEPGTPIGNGAAYHMAGNSFMRLKRFEDATTVYEHALKDSTYLKRAAVEANLANAYSRIGMYDAAISHFKAALEDPVCGNAYKCYQGMGAAFMEQDSFEQAAIAFRRAALDKDNPEPGKNLINLGLCLMSLERPKDAIQAYRAALATGSYQTPGKALSNLGIAYFQTGEWGRSIHSFEEAITLHGYKLSDQARSFFEQAKKEFEASGSAEVEDEATPNGDEVSDISLDEAQVSIEEKRQAIDDAAAQPEPSSGIHEEEIAVLAADLVGQSTDAFVPVAQDFSQEDEPASQTPESTAPVVEQPAQDMSDTTKLDAALTEVGIGDEEAVESFFGMTEKEAAQLGKETAKENRSKFAIVKWLLGLILVFAILAGAAVAVYYTGFGIPTPKKLVSDAMSAYNSGKAFESYWANANNSVREMAAVPVPSQFSIDTINVDGMKATVNVKVKPGSSSALAFKFNVVRRGIGWKISSVENDY